jgi:hypothetical protein
VARPRNGSAPEGSVSWFSHKPWQILAAEGVPGPSRVGGAFGPEAKLAYDRSRRSRLRTRP